MPTLQEWLDSIVEQAIALKGKLKGAPEEIAKSLQEIDSELSSLFTWNKTARRPTYRCRCGYEGAWDEAHNTGGHDLGPYLLDDQHVVCENGCEQDGCSLSDCVEWVKEEGNCPMCGGPTHVEQS